MSGYCKRILLLLCFFGTSITLSAQMNFGTTGLLNAPSAEMQDSKTVMIGGNFLNDAITPPPWNYGTFNYFLNVTIFPFFEVAYTATMFKAKSMSINSWYPNPEKFCNQDRYFSARFRVLKEGQFWKHMPAVVVGTSDPYTESGAGQVAAEQGNGYFCRFYIAATKHLNWGTERFGITLAYIYNRRFHNHLNGIAGGITYEPSFVPNLRIIADYDNRDFAVGASYLLFDQLHAQFEFQRFKYFTGGLCYKIHLK